MEIGRIESLKSKIGRRIRNHLKEFNVDKNNSKELFIEMCFCILVANNSVEKTKKVWEKMGEDFLKLSEMELRNKLKLLGCRFYKKRSRYIISARKHLNEIKKIFKLEEKESREWLVENIMGLGFKESSHFLRNIGYKNFAILDRHVLRVLLKYGIIKTIPKTLTKKKYLEIENKLKKICEKLNISMAELDLYLFYLETGKICEK
ncbi:MAG: N-glycosylase/DNA lyase [Candidatus Aenigmarchaeota archaeon]|nr:N-glycosylase/DNA lyase [Candidatus Aenigmarchaeota archaeon]